MEDIENFISIPILENEILEYNKFKTKYNKYKKIYKNNLFKCCITHKLRYYERKYKSKLFYLKMKYSYNNVYLQYYKGLETTDIIEDIIKSKEMVEHPLDSDYNDNITLINNIPRAYAVPAPKW